ncbi:hypothetical protein Poli38472_003580 [Pythium oligandrum]|uniref:Protein kinase domain-containing protein n=1 Tax=Pythium oligandrum TaxID=41045 RepID=A0A8K1CM48_PYTOL|nr:hypothetical protein Poli38472_003580 [Pythium oligandrum]|eukprot:TMW65815.1 hypothetical protein Poli38472_003580 [Pythium oligandrum]
MGNGASHKHQYQERHSDSRLSSIRLDGSTVVVNGRGESNTVTLRLPSHPMHSDENGPHAVRMRTRSLPLPDSARLPNALQPLHPVKETREDAVSSSTSSPGGSSYDIVASQEKTPRPQDDDDDYEDEQFEEEDRIEWKKAEALGSGSYGTVYLARDENTGALMAAKEILVADESDADVQNASREVSLLRSLHHENIEWVPGGNLEQNRKRFGGSELVVRRYARQILQGVAYLHSKKIVHHDIKPSNILVDQYGVVKLADFGSSRLMSTSTVVNNESLRGTPNYMAPEVIQQLSRSPKSDIWSVGCSVLRLLTGRALWGDKRFDSQIALLYYIANLSELPSLPEDLSDSARSFITACCAIDPTMRPSAEELLLHPFVNGSSHFPTVRAATAPIDTKHALVNPHRAPSTAPASDSPKTTDIQSLRTSSKSQLVSSRFPSLGIFDEIDKATVSSHRTKSQTKGGEPTEPPTRVVGTVEHDEDEPMYTLDGFVDPSIVTGRSQNQMTLTSQLDQTSNGFTWEDLPIQTDAARVELERQRERAAEAQRKREERERQYQEELVEYRRRMLQPVDA